MSGGGGGGGGDRIPTRLKHSDREAVAWHRFLGDLTLALESKANPLRINMCGLTEAQAHAIAIHMKNCDYRVVLESDSETSAPLCISLFVKQAKPLK